MLKNGSLDGTGDVLFPETIDRRWRCCIFLRKQGKTHERVSWEETITYMKPSYCGSLMETGAGVLWWIVSRVKHTSTPHNIHQTDTAKQPANSAQRTNYRKILLSFRLSLLAFRCSLFSYFLLSLSIVNVLGYNTAPDFARYQSAPGKNRLPHPEKSIVLPLEENLATL
jgi:hypothetical protein